jgi:SulP family sulfate permease
MAPRKSKFRKFNSLSFLRFFPFLVWAKTVTGQSLYADLLAGLTGAVIVLPQGIAYALIAGLPPEYGLYTAIITPIVAGLFGSSIHLISGPTAAISIVVMSVTSNVAAPGSAEFVSVALTITLLAGLIQFGFGVARFGLLVNYISHCCDWLYRRSGNFNWYKPIKICTQCTYRSRQFIYKYLEPTS